MAFAQPAPRRGRPPKSSSMTTKKTTTTRTNLTKEERKIVRILRGAFNKRNAEHIMKLLAAGALGAAGVSPENLRHIDNFYNSVRGVNSIRIGDGSVGMQGNFDQGTLNAGDTMVPFTEVDSVKRKRSAAMGYTTMVHKTKYHFGQPATRSVKQYARMNGTEKIDFVDTRYSPTYAPLTTARIQLSQTAGFNRKQVLTYGDAHFNATELMNLYDFTTWSPPENRIEWVYGLTTLMQSKYEIMNAGSYFPSKVTIKVYSPTSTERTVSSAILTGTPTQAEINANTPSDALALKYSLAGHQNNDGVQRAWIDPKASLDMSPEFDRRFKKVKQFSKTLQPGDVWEFDYNQHAGPGLRLDKLATIFEDSPFALVGNLVVIEHKGVPCEAVLNENKSNSFMGTSPSWIQVSFKKSIQLVKTAVQSLDAIDAGDEGGVKTRNYMIRAFSKQDGTDLLSNRIINYAVENIGEPDETGADIYIPVIANKVVEYARERSRPTPP